MHVGHDLENDQLKHGTRQCKGHRKDELNDTIVHLVVTKQLLHEEQPATGEVDHLRQSVIL